MGATAVGATRLEVRPGMDLTANRELTHTLRTSPIALRRPKYLCNGCPLCAKLTVCCSFRMLLTTLGLAITLCCIDPRMMLFLFTLQDIAYHRTAPSFSLASHESRTQTGTASSVSSSHTASVRETCPLQARAAPSFRAPTLYGSFVVQCRYLETTTGANFVSSISYMTIQSNSFLPIKRASQTNTPIYMHFLWLNRSDAVWFIFTGRCLRTDERKRSLFPKLAGK